jgi:very-short-patch-repair endonuclease
MPYIERLDRERARLLRRQPTRAERQLWRILHNPRLASWHFRRQHPIPPYVVDFACLRAKLVIEADGPQHGPENLHDRKRDTFLRRLRWRILRFCNDEILNDPDYVLAAIQAHLDPHPASPTPWGRSDNEKEDGDSA